MTLILERIAVREVSLGSGTLVENGRLLIDGDALSAELVAGHEGVTRIRIHLARPGESTRVVCCKDVVQPHVKVDRSPVGEGTSRLLDGVAVVTCGPIVGFQEGIIDMSGPGAAHTPFSTLALVVLEIDVADTLTPRAHEAALRAIGIDAAERLARSSIGSQPDRRETVTWNETATPAGLPRIGYLCMVLSQGLLHDTYVEGRNAADCLPSLVDPRMVLDAGVVSGNCVSACDKNTTYHHRNNPIVALLLDGHGTRWDFAGIVMTNQLTRLAEKERSARGAVTLMRELEVDGAIVSKEGFGNPDADFMMILRGLEQAGIRAVGVTDEFAGSDGESQSLADTADEADAIVSTGNANQRITLPPMSTTYGPLPDVSRIAGGYAGSLRQDGGMEVELQAIMGATNELGSGRLRCREI